MCEVLEISEKNYYKNLKKLNVLYVKLSNSRKYYTHSITKEITDNYDIISTESLTTKKDDNE